MQQFVTQFVKKFQITTKLTRIDSEELMIEMTPVIPDQTALPVPQFKSPISVAQLPRTDNSLNLYRLADRLADRLAFQPKQVIRNYNIYRSGFNLKNELKSIPSYNGSEVCPDKFPLPPNNTVDPAIIVSVRKRAKMYKKKKLKSKVIN
jgi:hypothetical protein